MKKDSSKNLSDSLLTEKALRESQAQLTAEVSALARLHEASVRLWETTDLHAGLKEMLDASIALLEADMGNIQLLNPQKKVLEIVVHRGFEKEFLDFFRQVDAADDCACGRTLREGKRTVIKDVELDPGFAPYRKIAKEAGYRAVQSTPLISKNGTPMGMLSTHFKNPHEPSEQQLRRLDLYARQATDFIERLRSEEALRQSEKHLKELTENLNRSNKDLKQFAFAASHDLQEPLRTISSYVDLLTFREKQTLSESGIQCLNHIKESTLRAHKLIYGLLNYASIEHKESLFQSISMEELLKQTLITLKASIEESSAQITYDPLPELKVNSLEITQLFQNLISNGLKFQNKNKPRIHISAARENGNWVFSVCDNGIGFEPKYNEEIFTMFKRLHAKNQYPGAGIGLALCKKIIEHHKGKIWVESKLHEGSTFYFSLPMKN